ncbi:uncharacterized protein LOC101449851 isoform X2 [Ceratitis capitata]|uniref:uncharacterized protein LOC101449851 isoform X2 n=1 Tax=Ceratitis capitata TaxID=7213 RepID=UPI000329EED2|nr:uncharacterized protein LOC101449851 isoform X2 [Ceratitis capitata]
MALRNTNNLHKNDNEWNDNIDEPNETEGHNNPDENTSCDIFVVLTDMVRNHYCNYLEKQLLENICAWRANAAQNNESAKFDLELELVEKATLKKCCRHLEDKAIKACMHARRYQRSMLKIIAEVRRSTQEFRLENEIKHFLVTEGNKSMLNNQRQKATQTDVQMFRNNADQNSLLIERRSTDVNTPSSLSLQRKIEVFQEQFIQAGDPTSILSESRPIDTSHGRNASLQHKIEMFQEHLNQATAAKVAATHKVSSSKVLQDFTPINNPLSKNLNEKYCKSFKFDNTFPKVSDMSVKKQKIKSRSPKVTTAVREVRIKRSDVKKTPPPINNITVPVPSDQINNVNPTLLKNVDSNAVEEDDEIALELAQLFSEEKSELEELLGLNSKSEMDDPQVRSVLEEIENASLVHELKQKQSETQQNRDYKPCKQNLSPVNEDHSSNVSKSPIQNCHNNDLTQPLRSTSSQIETTASNLRHSLWPCELYMQRRRLSASLSHLLEEDFRWHDLIKWKFHTLFGEDSEDEFAPCSPSIDLDEILICSCIRRISPWMVKHLMKPMRAGLIANRFLFKKLAKSLAHSIILENQYPNERFIKHAVEEYFCLHQAVVSLEDLIDMPNLRAINDNPGY